MQGDVNYNGYTLLSGGINVNTTGNIQALNVQITENGERTITPPEGVDGYAPITIDTNVPTPEPALDTLNVSSNGTYTPPSGVDGYDEVIVNVPTPEPVLDTLNVTQNGQYTPPSGVDGYDEVNVSISGYTIKTPSTTPTSIASFTDGTANPLKSLTASIVPVQDLHGYDSPWAGGARKNKFPIATATSSGAQNIFTAQTVSLKANTNYVLSFNSATPTTKDMSLSFKNGNTQVRGITISAGVTSVNLTFSQNVDNIDWYVREAVNLSNIMIEENSTKTTFEPYSNICPISGWTEEVITVTDDLQNPTVTHTANIPFTDGQGQSVEVFGGECDVVNGVVTPCPYYASYNGEQLTGEWISDRDVYAEGTTPTIGAQVVNIGATGTPFNAQPTSIKSLDGVNNVFASTGDVEELKYFVDL